jgi:hypothetical protein
MVGICVHEVVCLHHTDEHCGDPARLDDVLLASYMSWNPCSIEIGGGFWVSIRAIRVRIRAMRAERWA